MTAVIVAEVVGRVLAAHGVRHVFGVVGSGNFHVTNALVAGGARFVPAAHEARRGLHGRRVRPGRPAGSGCSPCTRARASPTR